MTTLCGTLNEITTEPAYLGLATVDENSLQA
jgi:hypothetical protein